jgi:anti-sigma factor RsiW
MTCSDFIEGFTDYIDGEADPSVRRAARTHLDGCVSCRRYERVYLEGRSLLLGAEQVEVGEDFHPRLQHRLYHVDDERALARSRSGSTSAALLLGAAALLMAAAWSPALFDEPEVELSPIVVDRPARGRWASGPLSARSSPSGLRPRWT